MQNSWVLQLMENVKLRYIMFTSLTIAALATHYHFFEQGIKPFSLVLSVPIVVAAVWHSGLYAGLITATMITIYSFLVVDDYVRSIMVAISFIFTVIPVAYLKHDAEKVGSVANVLNKLREIHSVLLAALVNWPDMEDEEKWNMVESVHGKISTVLTVARGWHLLAKERNSLEIGKENDAKSISN